MNASQDVQAKAWDNFDREVKADLELPQLYEHSEAKTERRRRTRGERRVNDDAVKIKE